MQTTKKIPQISSLENDFFKKNLENYLEIDKNETNDSFKKSKIPLNFDLTDPKGKNKKIMRIENSKKDIKVYGLKKIQLRIAKKQKSMQKTNLQKLLDKSMELPANMPQFLGKKHSRQSAA